MSMCFVADPPVSLDGLLSERHVQRAKLIHHEQKVGHEAEE